MKNPFESLNSLFKSEKPPERRTLRHPQEREIIEIALNNLYLSDMGNKLAEFANKYEIKTSVLRAKDSRDYIATSKTVTISVAEDVPVNDPSITLWLAGALRESSQEYDPHLKRVSLQNGETIYFHREQKKLEDKLFWQTGVAYELGKLANKPEFIDSFIVMGYYSLIEAYEKDLNKN